MNTQPPHPTTTVPAHVPPPRGWAKPDQPTTAETLNLNTAVPGSYGAPGRGEYKNLLAIIALELGAILLIILALIGASLG